MNNKCLCLILYCLKFLLLLLRRFSRVRLCATPQTAAHQAPPSLGFSRQDHWNGVPLPSPLKFLNEPNMTLRQLRGFLSITGYCCIWTPGYGKFAQPLYKLLTETQQAQTNKLVWSPETQKAFKALQTALLQAPTLSLPTGSEFVTEKKKTGYGHIA